MEILVVYFVIWWIPFRVFLACMVDDFHYNRIGDKKKSKKNDRGDYNISSRRILEFITRTKI